MGLTREEIKKKYEYALNLPGLQKLQHCLTSMCACGIFILLRNARKNEKRELTSTRHPRNDSIIRPVLTVLQLGHIAQILGILLKITLKEFLLDLTKGFDNYGFEIKTVLIFLLQIISIKIFYIKISQE